MYFYIVVDIKEEVYTKNSEASIDILDWLVHHKAIMARGEKLETKHILLHSSIHDLTDRIVEVEFENHSLKQILIEMKCEENVHFQNLVGELPHYN